MGFDRLAPQPPIFPAEAEAYAEEALARSRRAAAGCRALSDQAYGDDPAQRLDVYLPPPALGAGPFPILFFVHGGAWTNGYKEWMGLMAPHFTGAGIVLATPGYRLAPAHKWRAMRDDVLDALAWVHRRAGDFGADPSRLFVGGHSAGAHLTMLGALQPARLMAREVPVGSIAGCFPLSGPMDVRYPHRQPGSGEERTHRVLLDDAGEAAEASPIVHLHADAPPTLLAYGSADLPRVMDGNRAMAGAMAALGCRFEVLVLEGEDHFSVALGAGDAASPWVQAVTSRMLAPG